MKKCSKCGILKKLIDFQHSFNKKNRKTYFKNKCRECEKVSCKQYHHLNRNVILARKLKYDHSRVEEKAIYDKEYNKLTTSKLKNSKRALIYYNKRKDNISFKLKRNISKTIWKCLKKNSCNKNGKSILLYLNYSINELKTHLEKQFEPWMTWNNHGNYIVSKWDDNNQITWTWHLDHIIPQSDLPYTSMEDDNFKKCWALNNLRPYSAKQNLKDGACRTRHKNYV